MDDDGFKPGSGTVADRIWARPAVTVLGVDCPPVLGATPYGNLLLDAGHGALGFTLALGTGRVVADLAAGRASPVPLDGFRLDD